MEFEERESASRRNPWYDSGKRPGWSVPLVMRLIEGTPEHFLLNGNGSLITLKSFDFESDPNSFQLGVLVTDDRNTTTEEDIIVRVVNVVEDLDGDGFEDAFDPDLDGDAYPISKRNFMALTRGCLTPMTMGFPMESGIGDLWIVRRQ